MSSIALIVFFLAVALCRVAMGDSFGNTTQNASLPLVKILQKIVGGTAASSGQFPYQVQLQINTASSGYLCGGTLVSSSYVVTAAHCFNGLSGGSVTSGTVYAGSIYISGSDAQSSAMASYWTHPQFSSSTMYNDLAIITLASPFTLNSKVATMPLAAPSASFSAGTSCTVSGWGDTSSGGSTSNTLQYASVSIVSQTTCASSWSSLPATGICTTTTTRDTCQGDSGGPVICSGTARDGSTTNVLAGIVSYGSSCASGIPAVNTRVSSYSDLIYSKIGGSSSGTNRVTGATDAT